MARITKISITLCALLFILPYTPLTHASGQAHSAVHKTYEAKNITRSIAKNSSSKEKVSPTAVNKPSQKSVAPIKKKVARTSTEVKITSLAKTTSKKTSKKSHQASNVHPISTTRQCAKARKGHKAKCITIQGDKSLTIAQAHNARLQKAQKTAINKLMDQIGKPYRWGGASPRTGFDCSGLVYYAYKDLVKFRIPRTANEMFHLRDAASVGREELKSGDLVFFHIRGRGTADHVGVYVGNDKFIQSPRTGRDIQITSLNEDYWQRHYVGAKRVMTQKTIR